MIRDLAESARVYARAADLGFEAQNHAAEIRLRAEQRCGEILRKMADNGERANAENGRPKASTAPRLIDLGISEDQSSQWQRLAEAGPAALEAYVAEAKEAGTPITTTGALRPQGVYMLEQ